ncbi:MAG: hypothetical protein AUI15_08455 [Actinobacteria bacterium 13_2_20CM_2_66_6]|nr:MAG: hypothetical protein AUI15_08455 [Actinobacteria bacterium 13_2_20CM_2_66_6]
MRGELDRVVQRREFGHSAATEGAPDQVVRQVRVLRQQRAMQVRADNAALDAPFGAVAAVVARSDSNSAKRPRASSQKSASAVVFESDQGRRFEIFERGVHDHVADESFLACLGAHVDEPDAGKSLAFCCLVVVPEQLVAAAHRQHHRAVGDGRLQRLLLDLDQVVIHESLLTVLAATEEEDIHVFHSVRRAAAQVDGARVQATPLGSLEQRQDVAAVAVDVHQVRVQPSDCEAVLLFRHQVSQ